MLSFENPSLPRVYSFDPRLALNSNMRQSHGFRILLLCSELFVCVCVCVCVCGDEEEVSGLRNP